MARPPGPPTSVADVLQDLKRPSRAVVTAGMPYANGPLHLGHLAGAHIPADIYARYMGMLIGRSNVLFVSGTDEHGSTSELAAAQAGVPIRDFVDGIHDQQQRTLDRYSVGLDAYTGTSRPECFPIHSALSQDMLRQLHKSGMVSTRTTKQWFDPKMERFLPDRLVRGTCPNPKCGDPDAYSDECGVCGHQHLAHELLNPRSTISDATPVMKETAHLWLDMWTVSETLRAWLLTKAKTWRRAVLADVMDKVLPSLCFAAEHEGAYKDFKTTLPHHKSKYAPGKKVVLQFDNKADLETGIRALDGHGIASDLMDGWAHRPISRDIGWGIPIPTDIDPALAGKTLYVWPDSLIAPIAFSQVALKNRGEDPATYADFWRDPTARVVQFLGQDNVFFYVLMQGALWLGSQQDPHRLPGAGDLQLTDIMGCFHLMVAGQKMSKSRGNFYTADQLLDEKGYDADQLRYYLALLGLSEKSSDFDFAALDARNKFLAGPMNAAFERPISAAHSKFDGRVPQGVLVDKVHADTIRIVQRYVKAMERAEYHSMLFDVENYARTINSLFTQYKPHDDRHPEEARRNALYSAFYVLKNLLIMLHPFAPATMDRLRESLRLPPEVYSLDQLGVPMTPGHQIGPKQVYFPAVAEADGA